MKLYYVAALSLSRSGKNRVPSYPNFFILWGQDNTSTSIKLEKLVHSGSRGYRSEDKKFLSHFIIDSSEGGERQFFVDTHCYPGINYN